MYSKPIEIYELWNKFKGKFGWSSQQPELILLNSSVQPVTSIDDLLYDAAIEVRAVSVASGPGRRVMYTVPAGKRCLLSAVWVDLISGTSTINDLSIQSLNGNVLVVKECASATSILWSNTPLILEAGWTVAVYVDSWTNISLYNTTLHVVLSDVQ